MGVPRMIFHEINHQFLDTPIGSKSLVWLSASSITIWGPIAKLVNRTSLRFGLLVVSDNMPICICVCMYIYIPDNVK